MAPTILVLPGTHISHREVLGTTGMVVSIDHSSRLCVGQSCAQSMLVRSMHNARSISAAVRTDQCMLSLSVSCHTSLHMGWWS